jgi:hypothetical protein
MMDACGTLNWKQVRRVRSPMMLSHWWFGLKGGTVRMIIVQVKVEFRCTGTVA